MQKLVQNATTTTHNKTRLLILGRVGGGGVTARRFICLHSSVSCIGILSLSDCNESVAWTATASALSPSDFASLTGGWDVWDPTPGGGPGARELRGELLLCGAAAGSRDPFGRVPPPAAPRPAVNPSPFGIVSGLTGPERRDRGAGRQHISADKVLRHGALKRGRSQCAKLDGHNASAGWISTQGRLLGLSQYCFHFQYDTDILADTDVNSISPCNEWYIHSVGQFIPNFGEWNVRIGRIKWYYSESKNHSNSSIATCYVGVRNKVTVWGRSPAAELTDTGPIFNINNRSGHPKNLSTFNFDFTSPWCQY